MDSRQKNPAETKFQFAKSIARRKISRVPRQSQLSSGPPKFSISVAGRRSLNTIENYSRGKDSGAEHRFPSGRRKIEFRAGDVNGEKTVSRRIDEIRFCRRVRPVRCVASRRVVYEKFHVPFDRRTNRGWRVARSIFEIPFRPSRVQFRRSLKIAKAIFQRDPCNAMWSRLISDKRIYPETEFRPANIRSAAHLGREREKVRGTGIKGERKRSKGVERVAVTSFP